MHFQVFQIYVDGVRELLWFHFDIHIMENLGILARVWTQHNAGLDSLVVLVLTVEFCGAGA